MTLLPVQIRDACIDDAEYIIRFQEAMALETEGLRLDQKMVSKGVRAVFKDPSRGRYPVAEIPPEIIASLLITTEWSDWRNRKILWIHSVYVLPEYRLMGVFKKMYQKLHEMISSTPDIFGIRLYVHTAKNHAISLYHHLGMDSSHYRLFEWLK